MTGVVVVCGGRSTCDAQNSRGQCCVMWSSSSWSVCVWCGHRHGGVCGVVASHYCACITVSWFHSAKILLVSSCVISGHKHHDRMLYTIQQPEQSRAEHTVMFQWHLFLRDKSSTLFALLDINYIAKCQQDNLSHLTGCNVATCSTVTFSQFHSSLITHHLHCITHYYHPLSASLLKRVTSHVMCACCKMLWMTYDNASCSNVCNNM